MHETPLLLLLPFFFLMFTEVPVTSRIVRAKIYEDRKPTAGKSPREKKKKLATLRFLLKILHAADFGLTLYVKTQRKRQVFVVGLKCEGILYLYLSKISLSDCEKLREINSEGRGALPPPSFLLSADLTLPGMLSNVNSAR